MLRDFHIQKVKIITVYNSGICLAIYDSFFTNFLTLAMQNILYITLLPNFILLNCRVSDVSMYVCATRVENIVDPLSLVFKQLPWDPANVKINV